jgi:hypothetical protein
MRAIATGTMQALSDLPLSGPIIRRYQKHYDEAAEQESPQKLSEKVKGFFERWSIKLSVEYYEAKDAEAARSHAAEPIASPSVVSPSVASPPITSPPPARTSSTDLR